MMKEYTFAYGEKTVRAALPEEQVLGVLTGKSVPPLPDIGQALFEALDRPLDAEPLSSFAQKGHRVAVVISDITRFWMRQDLVLPHLIRYLNERCGVPDRDIVIVVATGTHEHGTEEEMKKLITPELFGRVRSLFHDCRAEDLTEIGVTAHGNRVLINHEVAAADRVICLGACSHHVMAGYGGGRKSILPGVSALSTIRYNHLFSLDEKEFRSSSRIGNCVTKGNPLNEDMCEAAGLLPHLFMINLVMNADMKLAAITAGHYLKSWEEGCRLIDSYYKISVPQKADVVFASCGGFPKDMSLYQGTKCIDNVEFCLKKGGTLILLMEARDGGGPEEFFGWNQNLLDGTFEERLRSRFTIPGYIFLLSCEQARRYRILLLSTIPAETLRPIGMESYQDMDALLQAADLKGKSIYVIPNGNTVMPIPQEA